MLPQENRNARTAHGASIVTMDLATRRLLIRDLQADDLAAMTELWTDADVGHFMGSYGPRSAEQTARWLEDTMQHNRARPRFAHNAAIILAQTSERAGWIGCGKSSQPAGDYDFGVCPPAALQRPRLRSGSPHTGPHVLPQ
jgi:RimJ/RimL family protein N-acetyltransferase